MDSHAGRHSLALQAAAALFVAVLARSPSFAAEAPSDEACLTCHASALQRSGGGSLQVDAGTLESSVHAKLACVDCHASAERIPHAERLAPVRCASCHASAGHSVAASVHHQRAAGASASCIGCHGSHGVARPARAGPGPCGSCHQAVVADYRGSVHGAALANGDTEASQCGDCHGPTHSILPHRDPRSTASRARLAETCARCHADRALMTRRKITIPEAYALYRRSVHGRSRKPTAATCNDCHESHRLRRAADPASSIHRLNIPTTCGRCHVVERREYGGGVHGTALARGVTDSPVCTDCHGEHMIRGPRDPGSPVAASGVTRTCSHCHEAEGIRETYGLPTGRLSTYRDSYHGLAARGGSPVVANCASCHGYHDILPSSDPRSKVNPRRLADTCGQCHPGAGTRFAMGPVHVAMTSREQPLLYWVRWIYLVLIGVVISGMALHNGLDFFSKLRRHWRQHWGAAIRHAEKVSGWYLRMTLSERVQHGWLAISFFTLVYTGFALKFPEAWPFAWLARLERGYAWRSLIHRGAALVMVGVALFHVGYLFTRRGSATLSAMAPRPRDARDLMGNLLYMLGGRDSPPAFERFGYAEKAEYWALVWGTAVMTVTGLVLWFENQSLRWMAKWVLDLATIVHYYEAWLAFLAVLVWHVYATVFNPDVYPMNWSWLTGRISEESLEREHRAEWQRIKQEEGQQEEPAP